MRRIMASVKCIFLFGAFIVIRQVPFFLATGGDTCYSFARAGANTIVYTGYLDHEALIHYMKTELGGTISEIYSKPQGRITISGS